MIVILKAAFYAFEMAEQPHPMCQLYMQVAYLMAKRLDESKQNEWYLRAQECIRLSISS